MICSYHHCVLSLYSVAGYLKYQKSRSYLMFSKAIPTPLDHLTGRLTHLRYRGQVTTARPCGVQIHLINGPGSIGMSHIVTYMSAVLFPWLVQE